MPIALVTGGSAGIGQATAVQLARQGTAVITTYRTHRDESEETVAEIEAAGGEALTLRLDLADIAGLGGFVADVRAALAAHDIAFGRIGEPEDTAKVIAFLLSDAAGWITGQIIEASGGDRL